MDKDCTTTVPERRWRFSTPLTLVMMLLATGGCRLCAECDDLAYPAYGGLWERTNRDGGRVGSVFDPAGARGSELVSRETPEKPDVTERKRQSESDHDDPNSLDDPPASNFESFESKDDAFGNPPADAVPSEIQETRQPARDVERPNDLNVRVQPGDGLAPVRR